MNISKQNIDDLTATITLTIEKEDYAGKVENVLKDRRKNAQIPGFRKGKVPMGLIQKQYGMSAQMDEINKLVSQELQKYISSADFKLLGEPLPSEQQETIDFDTQEVFDFKFDIGIIPEIEIEISDKDTVVSYDIAVEADTVEKQIAQFKSQYAEMINPEVVEEGDMVRGDVAQLDAEGNMLEGGIAKEAAVLTPNRLSDDLVKNAFVGAQLGAKIILNPTTAMGSEAEVASFLDVEKEAIVDADYQFIITEIVRYVDAELNEDLYKRVYPSETFATEEEFRARVEEDAKKNLDVESDMRFEWDARTFVIEKLKDVAFPEAFLKRWISVSNEGKADFDQEKLEADFPKVLDDIRWQLGSSTLAEKAELKVDAEDPLKAAKQMAAQQFAMYGMGNLPEEYYEEYAKKMLEDQNQIEQIIQKVMNDKVVAHVKANVKLKKKKITMEDFRKLYEQA